jgi:predicted naringenin-chalcone synthase
MVNGPAIITAVASSFPPSYAQEELWADFFAEHFSNRHAAELAYFSTGVERRHAVVNPIDEDLSGAPTSQRMDRYLAEAIPLGKEAVSRALEQASLDAQHVGLFAVVSCTGYATPGIDVRLARDLGMSPELKRLFIGHVGCHAALPALEMVSHYVVAQQRPAVLLCLELPSLHLQPPTPLLEDVVVHALFSDAASAVVVEPRPRGRSGLEVLDVVSDTDSSAADLMTWMITDHGFKMSLSRRVPELLAGAVEPLVDRLLARNELERRDIDSWVVHPGGPRILDVVATRLGISGAALGASRRALVDHGNCSSATVLLVLESLAQERRPLKGRHLVAMAFGPGLTLCAALMRGV